MVQNINVKPQVQKKESSGPKINRVAEQKKTIRQGMDSVRIEKELDLPKEYEKKGAPPVFRCYVTSPKNVVILTSDYFTKETINKRIKALNLKLMVNGTFYDRASRTTMAKVIDSDGPTIIEPTDSKVRHKVADRYVFVIEKKSEVAKCIDGKSVHNSKKQRLQNNYRVLLGGVALVDLEDKNTRNSLREYQPDKPKKERLELQSQFIKSFNKFNENYNNMPAYDGLNGHGLRPRTLLAIAYKNNRQKLAVAAIQDGGSGVTLYRGAREIYYQLSKCGYKVSKILVCDSGSSTFWAESSDKNNKKSDQLIPNFNQRSAPTTAIGVR